MSDQIQRLRMSGIRASVVKARESEGNELADDIELEENINEKQWISISGCVRRLSYVMDITTLSLPIQKV